MAMKILHIKWLRQLLLISIYILGVAGIVGSGGGGDDLDCALDGFLDDCVDTQIDPLTLPPPFIIPSGGAAEGFDKKVNSIAPALDSSDDIYVGGEFTIFKNSPVNRIARLNNDGSLDTAFVIGTGFDAPVQTVSPANDGSGDVYVGGAFTSYKGSLAGYIARLNLDGTLDVIFNTGTGFNSNVSIIVPILDGSGDLYVGGTFTSYNGTGVGNGLIRLNDNGLIDAGFSTGTGWGETSIALATDGSGDIYVARSSSPGIARLNSDGSIDAGFDTGASGFNDEVRAIAVAADGSGDVYVAGFFDDYNGTGNSGIVRLNSDGSLDSGFATTGLLVSEGIFITPAIDASGDIYVDSNLVNGIVRLNSDGTRDTGFETGLGQLGGFGDSPNSVALATDGSGDIYVGGSFTRYNIIPAARIARLTAEGAFVR
jgi:uncharacterized delta-60 repeat protein